MRVISYKVLGTFYSSWWNPKHQHHPSWDFSSFFIISLMQDFTFVHKLNCSGTFLVNKPEHRLCMHSSMCGCVNLTLFQVSFVDVLLFVRVVDVLFSIPSISGTDFLWTCHFKGKFSRLHLGVHTFPLFVEVISPRPEIFLVLGFSALWWVSWNENSLETRNLHNTLYIT